MSSGIPVVISTNGYGIPVKQVEANAPLMSVAENGYGTPIVLSDNGTPFIVQGGGGVLPWDGVTKFTATKGLHNGRYAFENYGIGLSNSNWFDFWTSQRWGIVLNSTTSDHIRAGFDPTPLMREYGTQAFQTYMAKIKAAIDDVLAHGLKIIVDMHVSFAGTYSDEVLMASHAAQNATWTRMKAVWREVALLCNSYPTDKVAFEVYNECAEYTGARYYPMIKALVTYLRSQVGNRTTFLIAPSGYADMTAFSNAAFVAADYGQNVGFVYHHYDPHSFTHQSLAGKVEGYFADLPFPAPNPDTGNAARSAAISAATAKINADSGLTAPQKTAMITEATNALTYYFDAYRLQDEYTGTETVKQIYAWSRIFGGFAPGNNGDQVRGWQIANGVADSAMFVTEIGLNRYLGTAAGALDGDAANYFAQSLRYMKKNGWAYAVYNDDDGTFSIRKRASSSPVVYGAEFDTALLDALDMWKPLVAWTPASETVGTFSGWFDGADAASLTGSPVSQWTDKSGAGNHATQATAGNRPALASGGGIDGNTGKYLDCAISSSNDNEAVFAVITMASLTGGSSRTIVGPVNSGAQRQWVINSNNLVLLRAGVEGEAQTTGSLMQVGSQLIEIQLSFNDQTIQSVNGAIQPSTGLHDTAFGTANTTRIAAKNGGEPLNGIIRELLIMPNKPSSTLAKQIRYYLKEKWKAILP